MTRERKRGGSGENRIEFCRIERKMKGGQGKEKVVFVLCAKAFDWL